MSVTDQDNIARELNLVERHKWTTTLPEPTLATNGLTVLEKRYLRRGEDLELEETPKELFARVAWGITTNVEEASSFYSIMANGEFLPNSPTLFNAGTGNGLGLSACYILVPEDSLESICQVKSDLMMIQKAGGGVGYDFSPLRPRGCLVRSCGATTDGPLPFIDSFCSDTNAIQQGAKRRGAQMGMLWVWHPDIWDFIHAKEDLSRWQNMNVSVKVTDEFMEAVIQDPSSPHMVKHDKWGVGYLQYQEDGTVKSVKHSHDAKIVNYVTVSNLFSEICRLAWKNGEPGLAFWDRVNRDWVFSQSGAYPIEATNPCGEIPGEDGMSCNLGSINLAKLLMAGRLNEDRYIELIHECVDFLDGVVSVNKFPVKKIARMNEETRRIGLGVMGWADLLFQLEIPYDSAEARELAEEMSDILRNEALNQSLRLAGKKGAFPAADKSNYTAHPRNAYQTMIAPTGTISIIADCSCGIEPIFSLAFERVVMQEADGSRTKMMEVNPYFQKALEKAARRLGRETDWVREVISYAAHNGTIRGYDGPGSSTQTWQKLLEVFQTTKDVSTKGHVLMQAAWQKGLDQACSKTINMPNDASLEEVQGAYKLAWENGCKGITVYRDGCRDGVQGQVQPMRLKQKEVSIDHELIADGAGGLKVGKPIIKLTEKDYCCPICKGDHDADEICPDQATDKRSLEQMISKYFPDTELGRGEIESLPDIREALQVKQRTPLGTLHVTMVHEGGELKEIFGQISKSGEQPAADLEAMCRLASLILRLGGTEKMVLKQLERIGSSQLIPTQNGKIMSIPDGLAVALKSGIKELQNSSDGGVAHEAQTRTIKTQRRETKLYREVCPECQTELYENSGCQSCPNPTCGFSRC